MNIKTFDNIEELKNHFNFTSSGIILEPDIHTVENETDLNERKFHDAEVLTTLAKNLQGDIIEIGTSHGHGTYKMATNTSGMVYTLNALPDQMSGEAVTHAISATEIGSYLKKNGIKNYTQFYSNSMKWEIPSCINNISMSFIDGCHDSDFVYFDSKNTYPRIKNGGFIVWHDFSPLLESKYTWIQSSMNGVRKFVHEFKINEVYHLKNSWVGFAIKS